MLDETVTMCGDIFEALDGMHTCTKIEHHKGSHGDGKEEWGYL